MSSSGKRRLSNGGALLGLVMEENEEETTRIISSSKSRRRSSIGGKGSSRKSPGFDPEKQQRLAQMYSKIIQMSTENKINDKNSWSLDLIDHMSDLIKDETNDRGEKGVNFQKASCTIEASVKIYTHRVDDTLNLSSKIIENLRGNIAAEEKQDEDIENPKDSTTKPAKRTHSIKTIEKNVENLNAEKIEKEHIADPLFHKMSKAFDEGGAKGMLMTNLRLLDTGSTLLFSCTDLDTILPDEPITMDDTLPISNMVNVQDLILNAGFYAEDLLSSLVCPAFDEYREKLSIPIQNDMSPITITKLPENDVFFNPITGPPISRNVTAKDYEYKDFYENGINEDIDDDNDEDYSPPMDDQLPDSTFNITETSRMSLSILGDRNNGKINWEAIGSVNTNRPSLSLSLSQIQNNPMEDTYVPNQEEDIEEENKIINNNVIQEEEVVEEKNPKLSSPETPKIVTTENDFAFFEFECNRASNAWVGAKHWRYNLKSRSKDKPGEKTEDTNNITMKTKKKSKKMTTNKELLIFSKDTEVPETAFVVKKSNRGDTNIFTSTAVLKALQSAEELILPPDAKLDVQDLCRLFLRPSVKVAPPGLRHLVAKSILKSSPISVARSPGVTGEEIVWGDVTVGNQSKEKVTSENGAEGGGIRTLAFDIDGQEAGYENGGYYDDEDDDSGGNNWTDEPNELNAIVNNEIETEVMRGLEINTSGLLKAGRMIQKVRIGYASKAKLVNVRVLKSEMWKHIDQVCSNDTRNENIITTFPEGFDKLSVRKSLVFTPMKRSDDILDDSTIGKSNDEEEEGEGGEDLGILSFRNLVETIGNQQRQGEVTLPYYFICLLHLANEKNLRITGDASMCNLFITRDD